MEFRFPYNLKPTRVGYRKTFYSNEFDIEKASKWFERKSGYLALSVDVGTETTRYKPNLKKYLNKLVYIRNFEDLKSLRDKLVEYSPEDVYYTPTEYRDGSVKRDFELIFDISPERINCNTCKFRKRSRGGNFRTFCEECAEEAAQKVIQLDNLLLKHFDKVSVFFNGIGYYVVVTDQEAVEMDPQYRKELAKKIEKEFPIDYDLTVGEKDVVRLPHSLNSLVSRKVIEVSRKDLKEPERIYKEKSLPEFLKD